MNAIVLAAGRARRLAPLTDHTNKCLLSLGGLPLLARMLEALDAVGVGETTIVIGHGAARVRAVGGRRCGRMAIRYIDNPEYSKGSALSLYAARALLGEEALIMDADVLFPVEFLRRLLAVPAASAFLVDRGFRDTGEEVKIYTLGERVMALGKKVVPDIWDGVGEGVGFFKCGTEGGAELIRLLEEVIMASAGGGEYEDALDLLVRRRHVGWADVTGLPWTEIDFVEDLRRAEADILPRVIQLNGR